MTKERSIGAWKKGLSVSIAWLVGMCALAQSVSNPHEWKPVKQEVINGWASYYADSFHGRWMSNGERYHKDSLTCAHRSLPFGTRLLVRNKRNGREVLVTVTDRGPFSKRFTIDLSRAAAREIGIIAAGHSPVEIMAVDDDFVLFRIPYKIVGGHTSWASLWRHQLMLPEWWRGDY